MLARMVKKKNRSFGAHRNFRLIRKCTTIAFSGKIVVQDADLKGNLSKENTQPVDPPIITYPPFFIHFGSKLPIFAVPWLAGLVYSFIWMEKGIRPYY